MQRSVLLGAGAVGLAVVAFVVLRSGRHVAGKAVDQTVDQIIASLPPGYQATHGATDVNPLTGTVTVHDFAVTFEGKPVWSADTVSASGADTAALRDVFDPAAYPNGHPAWTTKRLLLADGSASGVRVPVHGGAEGVLTVKSVTLHQLSGRPFMAPPTREAFRQAAFQADAALAYAYRSFAANDIAFVTSPPRIVKLTIGSMTEHEHDSGKVGSGAVRDVVLDVPAEKPGAAAVHATLALAEAKDVDTMAQLEAVRQSGQANAKPSLNALTYGRAGISDFAIDIDPGPHITLQDLHGHFPPADAGGARSGDASMTGLTIALKNSVLKPSTAAVIAAFGMTALTIDLEAKTAATTTPPRLKVDEDIVLHELGTLHLTARLDDYDRDLMQRDAKAALMTTAIGESALSWQDKGLVNRAFAAAAAQMHTTPDVIRAQLAMPLVTLGLLMPDQPDAADQVGAFLKNPNIITLTVKPPEKVTLAQLAATPAPSRAHVLGLRIEAK